MGSRVLFLLFLEREECADGNRFERVVSNASLDTAVAVAVEFDAVDLMHLVSLRAGGSGTEIETAVGNKDLMSHLVLIVLLHRTVVQELLKSIVVCHC